MNGAARPLLAWTALLMLFGVIDAIWTGKAIQIAMVAAASLAILVVIGFVVAADPSALGNQAPRPRRREVVITASAGAVGTGIGLGATVYGLAFGRFLILLGAVMLLAGLGRWLGEWRAERRATR